MSGAGGGDPLEQAQQQGIPDHMIAEALAGAEQTFIRGGTSLRQEIGRRREASADGDGWRDPDDARDVIDDLEPEAQRQQFERARGVVLNELSNVFAGWHVLVRSHDTSALKGPLRSLVLSLHNPMIQESLLVAVADPYEEEAREFLAEIAALLWGFIEALGDVDGDHLEFYLSRIEPSIDAFSEGNMPGVD